MSAVRREIRIVRPSDLTGQCKWLHEQLEELPSIRHPFNLGGLPLNGIYFFYEEGEQWGHGGARPRIVRVGTHRDGNFRSRISEHYALNPWPVSLERPSRKDRSVFRKHLGRALLSQRGDRYRALWDLDLIKGEVRRQNRHLRDLDKEQTVETEVTQLVRERFWFRYIVFEGQARRMGANGIERHLIGTLSGCRVCRASQRWLGHDSPVERVRASGLWLVQHLWGPGLTDEDQTVILDAIARTRHWMADQSPGQ